MSATENNKAVIRKFLDEVINQNRMDRADDLVVEDFLELDPLPGQRQGRESLKEVLGMMRAAFPDIHWVVEEMVAEGRLWSLGLRGLVHIVGCLGCRPRAGVLL